MIEQHRFRKRSWSSTKKERIARKRKIVSSGIEAAAAAVAAASSKGNNKSSRAGTKGITPRQLYSSLVRFPENILSIFQDSVFSRSKRTTGSQLPDTSYANSGKRKNGRNTNRIGAILTTEKWRKGTKNYAQTFKRLCWRNNPAEMEIAAATENKRARQETRRDKTRRQDKQARRGDATLLPSRSLTRGLQIEDPK